MNNPIEYLVIKLKPFVFYLIVVLILSNCSSKVESSKIEPNYIEPTPVESTVVEGTFKDTRDGQEYGFVVLKDGKKWMSENLNFDSKGSYCYDHQETSCDKYGRLYDWEIAQSACPPGWHLPSEDEWWEMTKHYGKAFNGNAPDDKENNAYAGAGKSAYKALINGGDAKFNALLGGAMLGKGFVELNKHGDYWTSTLGTAETTAWVYVFSKKEELVSRNFTFNTMDFSCRCVADEAADSQRTK